MVSVWCSVRGLFEYFLCFRNEVVRLTNFLCVFQDCTSERIVKECPLKLDNLRLDEGSNELPVSWNIKMDRAVVQG